MSQVQQLFELQQLDIDITRRKQRLSEVLQGQREGASIQEARASAAAASEALATWQKEQRRLDLDIRHVVSEAEASEQRLYSGKVKNPKELSDLQLKIKSLKTRRSELEDTLLEAMIEVEDAEAASTEADATLREMESSRTATLARLQLEQAELVGQLNQLIAARKARLKLIEPTTLRQYDAARKHQRNGIGVAALDQGRCQVCLVTVSAQTIRLVDEGQITHCSNCGRILCFP